MKDFKEELIAYRLKRAWEAYDDATILAERGKWNSTINRLYYSCFYAATALLIKYNFKTSTHSGVKTILSGSFIKQKAISSELGKIYAQLFTFRQKGDYSDFFDFDEEKVMPFFVPTKELLERIEELINTNN